MTAKPTGDSFVLIWDLETSNLDPRFGFILVAGWKAWRGGQPCPCHKSYRVHLFSMRDAWRYHACRCGGQHRIGPTTNDKHIVTRISATLMASDAHVTYNGKRFDWRWVQRRRWIHGLALLHTVPHIDLMYTARSHLGRGYALKSISMDDPTLKGLAKSPVTGKQWVKAVSGDERALRYVEEHCRRDVLVLEHEYERMQTVVWQHPRLNLDRARCKFCDGRLIKRGSGRTARLNRPQQFQCTACHKYQQFVVLKKRVAIKAR